MVPRLDIARDNPWNFLKSSFDWHMVRYCEAFKEFLTSVWHTAGDVVRNVNEFCAKVQGCTRRFSGVLILESRQCSVFDAELRGALDGLHHAWSLGATKVILELDNLAIVRVIKRYEDENHPLGVFRQIKHLLQKPWEVRVQHYHREENIVADCLAAVARHHQLGLQVFDTPPPQVIAAFKNDSDGVSRSSLVML
ncbi:hypothetical protein Goshw_029823 [Gossypium schwendimanii]|uniref:RNase H type-1 domain-containing protein n=1 Tax=Gossypium schwendimanii TaxID=34291 RepID=A0A7J9KPA5_GOSSC|nr:hypothetical protein [Gossypium schwendimanii]